MYQGGLIIQSMYVKTGLRSKEEKISEGKKHHSHSTKDQRFKVGSKQQSGFEPKVFTEVSFHYTLQVQPNQLGHNHNLINWHKQSDTWQSLDQVNFIRAGTHFLSYFLRQFGLSG